MAYKKEENFNISKPPSPVRSSLPCLRKNAKITCYTELYFSAFNDQANIKRGFFAFTISRAIIWLRNKFIGICLYLLYLQCERRGTCFIYCHENINIIRPTFKYIFLIPTPFHSKYRNTNSFD